MNISDDVAKFCGFFKVKIFRGQFHFRLKLPNKTWNFFQVDLMAFAVCDVFKGHVKAVDTVAGQQDWFAADVKLYKTIVSIDEQVEGLKPGMSAEVTIYAEETTSAVLTVPVQAIVGTVSLGARPQCYVVGADGQPQPRDLVLGMSNQRLVEVKSGLQEGDKVVLNPSSLTDPNGDKKAGLKGGEGTADTGGSGKK